MDKDSKRQRIVEDPGGGLLPAVEGHNLEYNRTDDDDFISTVPFHVNYVQLRLNKYRHKDVNYIH